MLSAVCTSSASASSGNGSSDHLTAELFWQQTNTTGIHVPYKGGGPVMIDLLGGQIDSSFMNINTAMPQILAGKLRALSITSVKRSPLLPNVPSLEELGFEIVANTPEQFSAYQASEFARWKNLIQSRNIKAD